MRQKSQKGPFAICLARVKKTLCFLTPSMKIGLEPWGDFLGSLGSPTEAPGKLFRVPGDVLKTLGLPWTPRGGNGRSSTAHMDTPDSLWMCPSLSFGRVSGFPGCPLGTPRDKEFITIPGPLRDLVLSLGCWGASNGEGCRVQ